MKSNHSLKILSPLFCVFLLAFPQNSQGGALSKVDDILEGVVLLNKKSRGLPDNQAVFKQSETFENLIKRDPDMANSLRRKATKIDDAQAELKKLNLPPGSKLADEFLSLDASGRYAVSQLAETTQIILKRSDGADVLTRLDKSGLLLVQRFGNDVVEPISFVVKSDEIWDGAATAFKALKELDPAQMRHLSESLKSLPLSVNVRTLDTAFSNSDRVRLSYHVLKKYGKKGFDNLVDLSKKCWDIAKRHPKKASFGAAIAVVWFNPDLVLDPLGRLKDNAVVIVEGIAKSFGEALGSVPGAIVKGMHQGVENKVREYLPNMPEAISSWVVPIIVWLITISGFLFLLYLIAPLRFIPKAIVGGFFRIIRSPFRGRASKRG